MDLGIEGRVAVVTGASRGIGQRVVARLREEGATVVEVSRGTGIDVTAPDAAERIAEIVNNPVDILVNNAGSNFIGELTEITDEQWNALWELHVMASMRLMRAFAPQMAERGWGRIVNVASSAGKRPSQTNAAYSVSKTAQLALSRVYADAFAAKGVLVNAVTPGPTTSSLWVDEGGLADQTAAARGGSHDDALAAQASRVPIRRYAEPQEIADVIVFLCSERASYVTGAAWSADGGAFGAIL